MIVVVEQPVGTVTMVFTDIEGSTQLLRELGQDAYRAAIAEHRSVVRGSFAGHGGYEVDYEGDSFFFAFPSAGAAVAAVTEAMRGLEGGPIRIRVGIHTGEPGLDPPKYVGLDVHRAARIMSAGHGGQVVISQSTRDLLEESFPLRDLGEHRLKDLGAPQRLYQLQADDLPDEFPPLRSLFRTNLPVPATPFLGRERELGEVVELLTQEDVRLLTLTGTGGTGKTRLAAQAAAELGERYPDGVWWVPLAPLRDPQLVLASAAQALDAKIALADHIADKTMLLLFDNFEQVVQAAAGLASLLASCPNLDLLTTSREPLHITGEQEYPVPPLVHEEGVGFFLARARAVDPGFQSDTTVSEICRRLDDLPLALELAAARVKALSSAQILERLEQRLPLLTGGARDLPERQRTLRATIEWSYELLAPDEKQLFARLAVFSGGCTLESAEEVAGADLDILQSLIDKSLLRRGEDRYWMLETIREYAAERLEESPTSEHVRLGHAQHYVALAEALEPALYTGGQRAAALAQLDHELANVRAARNALEESGGFTDSLRLGTSLWRYWMARGSVAEAREWISTALEAAEPVPDAARAHSLEGLSILTAIEGEHAQSLALADASLALYRRLEDGRGVRETLNNIGTFAYSLGDMQRAELLFDESAALSRAAGDDPTLALALSNLGGLALESGECERAAELGTETLGIYRRIGDEGRTAQSSILLGVALLLQGELTGAAREFQSALKAWPATAQLDALPLALIGLAATLCEAGKDTRAARLTGAADGVLKALGGTWGRALLTERELHDHTITTLRERLGDDAFEQETAVGLQLTPEAAVAYALAGTER